MIWSLEIERYFNNISVTYGRQFCGVFGKSLDLIPWPLVAIPISNSIGNSWMNPLLSLLDGGTKSAGLWRVMSNYDLAGILFWAVDYVIWFDSSSYKKGQSKYVPVKYA
jgi:hypothetical protein